MLDALQPVSTLINWIAAFIVGGGALVTITYQIFKFLAQKWLTSKFDQSLAAYKHAQQKELENLRLRINTLMDRTVKLHQREFEVLPEIWARLTDAMMHTMSFISPLQRYPDLDQMSSPHLDEFLEKSELMEFQRNEVRQAHKKTDYYVEAIFWHRLANVKKLCREYHIYLLKNGIFVPESMKAKFKQLDDLIFNSLSEQELNKQLKLAPAKTDAVTQLNSSGSKIFESLEHDIQSRLWGSELTKA